MHDDESRVGFRDERQHFFISASAGDGRSQSSACLNRRAATSDFEVSIEIGTSIFVRNFSITGITRRNPPSGKQVQRRSCRFTTDVNDVRAFCSHFHAVLYRFLRRKKVPAVGK